MMRLPEFFARAGLTPWAYGRHDCCLWLADWVLEQRGIDPAADLRGRYSTARGCARILKRAGGVAKIVGRCATIAGLAPTTDPQPGDVGVVIATNARGKDEEVGAIKAGADRWAFLTPTGLSCAPVFWCAAWSMR